MSKLEGESQTHHKPGGPAPRNSAALMVEMPLLEWNSERVERPALSDRQTVA